MRRIIAPFNRRKKLVDLNLHPANGGAYSSVVLLADLEKQTRAEVRYGLHDQPIALELNSLGIRIHRRALHPGDDDFKSVCDLLLQLDQPIVYRTDQVGARQGYCISEDELHSVLEAAQQKQYKHLSLENFETQYDTLKRFDHFNGVDIVYQRT